MLTVFSYVLNGYSHAKKVHSNLVVFKNHKNRVKFRCVTFAVTDARVNPSQPNHIKIGKKLPHYHSDRMQLIVAAGRKKSKAVARYFNDQVGIHNLYGEHPKKLNFAVKGTLAAFQDHACTHKIVEFKNILMAQEYDVLLGNVWLIGGKNCWYQFRYHRVNCRADYNPNQLYWSFSGKRANYIIDITNRKDLY